MFQYENEDEMKASSEFNLDQDVTVTLNETEVDGVVSGFYVDHSGMTIRVDYFDANQSKQSDWFRENQLSPLVSEDGN